MGTFFYDPTGIEHHDLIGVGNRREPVRYHHYGLPSQELIQSIYNGPLVVSVKGVGRLVQKDVARVLIYRPCNEQPLPLPLTHTVAPRPDHGIYPQGQLLDEVLDVGYVQRLVEPIRLRPVVALTHVVGNRIGEDEALLHHHPALITPGLLIELADIALPYRNFSLSRRIKAQQ